MSASLHTLHQSRDVDDFSRRYVLNLWSTTKVGRRLFDTKDISKMTGLSEAQVYNIIAQRKTGGVK